MRLIPLSVMQYILHSTKLLDLMIIHGKDCILFQIYVWGKNLLTADTLFSQISRDFPFVAYPNKDCFITFHVRLTNEINGAFMYFVNIVVIVDAMYFGRIYTINQ